MVSLENIMKRHSIRLVSIILVIVLCCFLGFQTSYRNTKAEEEHPLENGTYTITSFLRSATSDQASMGNAGIVQPVQIIAKDGKLTVRVQCKALSTKLGSVSFTGYLAKMSYFPDWQTSDDNIELPENETPVPVNVESYFEKTYDRYNDPKTGTDPQVKGKLYPHYLNFPIKDRQKEMWVQVYVPVMESISKGSGLQYARFQFDWSTLKKISDSTEINQGKPDKTTTTTTTAKKTTTTTKKTTKLNIKKLKGGIYSINGKMLKTDKKTESMANDAINHKIKLTVKNGTYYLTLDFKALNISSSYGYLSKIKYFTNGYQINQYKVPTGTTKNVTISSYQKDSKGKKVKDSYGTNYPDKVTFPLIKRALNDGYVPLQVFVPIMDAISPGSGTQAVYLKLDLSSVKKAKSSSQFQSNDKNVSVNTSSHTTTTSSNDHQAVTIKSAALPKSNKQETTATQALNVQNDAGFGQTNTETVQQTKTTVQTNEEETDTPIIVPSVMSVLISLAGIFYKIKSRGL